MLGSFATGVQDARRGAALFAARPRLWKYLVAPLAIAAPLLVLVIWVAFRQIQPMIADLTSLLPDWLGALVTAVNLFVLLLLFVAAYFVYASVAMLLLAPFCEMISEAIEVELTGATSPPFSLGGFARDLVVGIAHAARRLLSYLFVITVLLVVGLVIPVVGPLVAAGLGAAVTVQAAAYDAYDAVWARKGMSYRKKMDELSRGRAYGLGAAITVLLAIPVLNIVALPVGAAGATLAWLDSSASRQT